MSRKMKKAALSSLVFLLIATNLAKSATITVRPDGTGDYPTIQAAIDAAVDGDTVLVAPGTYTGPGNRDINFKGKAITVRSENGPESCIIDCNGTESDPHRGFYFHSGEDANSIVDGFTITNGYAKQGGGIHCNGSGPTITNCNISHNVVVSTDGERGRGCGIYCYQSNPSINNCVVSYNSEGQGDSFGGGIYCELGNLKIINSTIAMNDVYAAGGGIECFRSTLTIANSIVTDNKGSLGGGICLDRSGATITNCVISRNVSHSAGGGVSCDEGDLIITNSTISGNSAVEGGGICGGENNSTITNSIISDNSASAGGGGLKSCTGPITNCTITANSASYGGGLYKCDGLVSNCIIWDNSPQQIVDIYNTTSVICSDVQGGWLGESNIDADPFFVDPNNGDYHLLENSPCINTGDPNYVPKPNETDLDGLPRIIGGRIDMGAYELNHIPIADPGPDQTITSDSNGLAQVTLDGSASYDEDGDELTYLWTWTIDGNSYDANGVNPTIELPVGKHTIQLVVNDCRDDSEPNQVIIKVEWQQITSQLWVTPRIINRESHQQVIIAMLRLPPGITRNQIDNTKPLMLFPGGIPAAKQYIIPHFGRHCHRHLSILAFFNKAALMTAVPNNGRIQLQVTGQLKTGQPFYGTDTVIIIGKPKPHKPPKT